MSTESYKDYSIEGLESTYRQVMESLNNKYKARVIIWSIVIIFLWSIVPLGPIDFLDFILSIFFIFIANMYIDGHLGRGIRDYEGFVEEIEQEFSYRNHRLPDGVQRSLWSGR